MWAGCFEGYGQTPCADEWNEDVSHPSSWVEGFQHLGQQPTRHFPGDPSGGAAITVLHVEESEDVCVASKNAPRLSLLSLWYYSTTTTTIFTQTQRIIDNRSRVTLCADFLWDSCCALRPNFTAQSSEARGQRETRGGGGEEDAIAMSNACCAQPLDNMATYRQQSTR